MCARLLVQKNFVQIEYKIDQEDHNNRFGMCLLTRRFSGLWNVFSVSSVVGLQFVEAILVLAFFGAM